MTTVLVILAVLGVLLVIAALLHGEWLPGVIGLVLILLASSPEQVFKGIMYLVFLYFIYWILIGIWL